jgi:hypothetical protein
MGARHLGLLATNAAINQKQFYQTFTDRNLGILTPEQQKIISETRVAQTGLGVNSDVLLTMVQLSFQHFTIADPDTYELSNCFCEILHIPLRATLGREPAGADIQWVSAKLH